MTCTSNDSQKRLLEGLGDPAQEACASAPSMTRWSYESDSGSISRGTNAVPL